MLRNRESLKEEHAVRLQELLAANQPLATAYLLKDALKEVWYAPSVLEGWRRWRTWLRYARESGLAPLQRFARNLQRYARGILASARFHLHASLLEGVNNRIKVIKRMAYGFRDSKYFFLKIKAAFPRENAMSQRKAPKCLFYLSALHQLWALCTAMGEVATLGSPAIAFCS